MKKYKVKFLCYHESFSGHEHCDGWREVFVEARNEEFAIKKARKKIQAGWVRNTIIEKVLDFQLKTK